MKPESFTLQEISQIVLLLRDNDVTEFSLERGGDKLFLKRGGDGEVRYVEATPVVKQIEEARRVLESNEHLLRSTASSDSSIEKQELKTLAKGTDDQGRTKEIRSPMVGTFYRRSSPEVAPFVNVGDVVAKGKVLCIIEAMKVMNEIESDVAGRVTEVCLEDGDMVEFEEVIFRIEPV